MNCIITPTNKFHKSFIRTINSVLNQSINHWEWIIVNDSGSSLKKSNDVVKLILNDPRIKIIDNLNKKGAGSARNYALDCIMNKYESCNLFFIDAGDEWFDFFMEESISNFDRFGTKIVSGSYLMKWPDGKTKKVIRSGKRTYSDMLEDYSTSCLSTALKLENTHILSRIRFGETMRVNDQPFFLSAVKHFGQVIQISDIQATYHVGDLSSLSGKKIHTAIGKWKVLKDQNLNFFFRCYCFALYFLNGIKKYYL